MSPATTSVVTHRQLSRHGLPHQNWIYAEGVLSLPITTIDEIIFALEINPGTSEKLLMQVGEANNQSSASTGESNDSSNVQGQVVQDSLTALVSPTLAAIAGLIGTQHVQAPDVTLTAGRRRNDLSSIVFSPHLEDNLETHIGAIPKAFSKTRHLHAWLTRTRHWLTETLGVMYMSIADRQRNFIYSGNLTSLKLFPGSAVGTLLGLSESTISRIRRDRLVHVITADQSQADVPAYLFMPTAQRLQFYLVTQGLNAGFAREFKDGRAYIDTKLLKYARSTGTSCSRRSVTKYRGVLGIPSAHERTQAYMAGRSEPYHAPTHIRDLSPS